MAGMELGYDIIGRKLFRRGTVLFCITISRTLYTGGSAPPTIFSTEEWRARHEGIF